MNNGPMTLMLVDIATVYYRAYYALPDTQVSPDGRQINAVRGTLDALMLLVDKYQPAHLVTCWDFAWRPEWRVELLPTYKTARVADEGAEQMPDTLSDQVDSIRTILTEWGVDVIGLEDYESDDIVGSYCRTHPGSIKVVTGDRDLFQLINDEHPVEVLYLATGVSKHTNANNAYILERYGIHSHQYGDFSILRGDPSDGLPGVKGIGEKTAAKLLTTFGNISGVIEAARSGSPEIKPKASEALLSSLDYLAAAEQVVLLNKVLDVPAPNSTWRSPQNSAHADELGLKRYNSGWQSVTDY